MPMNYIVFSDWFNSGLTMSSLGHFLCCVSKFKSKEGHFLKQSKANSSGQIQIGPGPWSTLQCFTIDLVTIDVHLWDFLQKQIRWSDINYPIRYVLPFPLIDGRDPISVSLDSCIHSRLNIFGYLLGYLLLLMNIFARELWLGADFEVALKVLNNFEMSQKLIENKFHTIFQTIHESIHTKSKILGIGSLKIQSLFTRIIIGDPVPIWWRFHDSFLKGSGQGRTVKALWDKIALKLLMNHFFASAFFMKLHKTLSSS